MQDLMGYQVDVIGEGVSYTVFLDARSRSEALDSVAGDIEKGYQAKAEPVFGEVS